MVMAEDVQPGWRVVDSAGEEVGTVIASPPGPTFRIRRDGGGEVEIPNSACAYIETGRVELTMSKKDLSAVKATS